MDLVCEHCKTIIYNYSKEKPYYCRDCILKGIPNDYYCCIKCKKTYKYNQSELRNIKIDECRTYYYACNGCNDIIKKDPSLLTKKINRYINL